MKEVRKAGMVNEGRGKEVRKEGKKEGRQEGRQG